MTYPDTFESKIGFTAIRQIVSSHCLSALGREECKAMAFSADFTTVSQRLNSTFEMLSIISADEAFPLTAFEDLTERLTQIRTPGTFLSEAELLGLHRTLTMSLATASFFRSRRNDEGVSPYPELDSIARSLEAFPEITARIDRTIDRFGNVKDNASKELAEIRSSLASINGTIGSIMRRVMANAVTEGYIPPDTAPSVRDGRLVIPVPPAHKRKISGIVHDESSSGKTVFIEPAQAVEANNRLRELQIEERREITRILIGVADEIRPEIDNLLGSYSTLGIFDFIHAKALFARQTCGSLPSISEDAELEWYHACHPILLLSLSRQGKETVPLDITLSEENRILVISGPNAGGKSVCLKTVGIVQYMSQCGLLPPLYDNSRVGMFKKIFVDIGDDQSIENDLSTYSSHLKNMKHFLSNGDNSTLILIDEFGSGTEPQIGGAIAQALLEEFNAKKMWGVVTTHYQNLKHFAEDTPGLINGAMLYDRHLMQPLFKLSIGNPGSSFAIEIARKIGLPQGIIKQTEALVGSSYVNLDKYLQDIVRDKRYWENKRYDIRQKQKKLEETLERYQQEAAELREKSKEIISQARQEARQIIESSNASVERAISEIRKHQADKQKTLDARQQLLRQKEQLSQERSSQDDHPLLKKAPRQKRKPKASETSRPIRKGDNVIMEGQQTVGTVLEVTADSCVVAFGMLKTTVKTERLKLSSKPPKTVSKKSSFISESTVENLRERQLNFKSEIDVRGMRSDEAVQAITYFIDDAIQFNCHRVRILHGTGTGALRQSIRQYLSTVKGIVSSHDEHVQFGGAGITVVELE